MMINCKIRYFHRGERLFKDRYLYLDTGTLDPATRAAVELIAEDEAFRFGRDIFRYRHLFVEQEIPNFPGNPANFEKHTFVGPVEYLEDEAGHEINGLELGPLLTGNPDAIVLPSGTKPHDAELMVSKPQPIPLAEVTLTPDEIRILVYFTRDVKELRESTFYKEGPGTWSPSSRPALKTAVSDDEIRSFVTIFRRLYMTGHQDPASFVKAVPIFLTAVKGHPWGKWVDAVLKDYQKELSEPPEFRPFFPQGTCTFTTKRLIDVFLYTQYAHQPNANRERQFNECLADLNGNREALTWLFLGGIWKQSMQISNAGQVIAKWFSAYCTERGVQPSMLASLKDDHVGFGSVEKKEKKRRRLFNEKLEKLATDLWMKHGQPEGGPNKFLPMASQQLAEALGRNGYDSRQ